MSTITCYAPLRAIPIMNNPGVHDVSPANVSEDAKALLIGNAASHCSASNRNVNALRFSRDGQ